jgi:bifunctional non-homologous end joining protein LigD
MADRKLETYRRKRDFRRTGEPAGGSTGDATGNLYMIHKHAATRLHYDLRLQVGDVLKSWAVPKGPSLDPHERRLAVEVEDHPLEYGAFEGVIPEGQYGAGATLIWDSGTWAPMGDLEESLKSGTLKFRLAGEKLKGGWTLVRLKPRKGDKQPNWLLIKEHDDAASTDGDILEERPESVVSGKQVEDLLNAGADVWSSGKPAARQARTKEPATPAKAKTPVELRPGALKGAHKGPLPKTFKPQLASPVEAPPEGDGWLHEIKLDGYRTIAIVADGRARLITRGGHDWTDRYGDVAKAFEALPSASAIIDGEIVVPDERGITRFGKLQDAIAEGETWRMIFYAFDLMYLNGWDLTDAPLTSRKALLEKLLSPVVNGNSAIQLSEHVVGQGAAFFEQVSDMQLEGVVSKRVNSAYRSGRTKTWVKVKAKQSGIFPIIGYTTSSAAGGLAALFLGEDDGSGLRSVGKVGTGFSAEQVSTLADTLARHARAKPPVKFNGPTPKAHWVEPVLTARIRYSNKTADGNLRHAVFKGLQEPERRSQPNMPKRLITDTHLANIWVTNPDRRMFSKDGPTKLDLAVYYARVGDYMLPHILNRPVSLVRCPTGNAEDCFFQRHVFSGMPAEIGIFPSRKTEEKEEERDYLFVKDAEGYLALAQFGVVEFHPWGCRVDKPERPDRMFFDLDPGDGVEWRDIVSAALALRSELTSLGLAPFVKTSGGKGIHVVVPINRRHSWKEVHGTSGKIASLLAKKFPGTFVANMSKKQRKNRIFVDFHRNARSATAVAAFSLRARAGLPASTPLDWDDLASIDAPADLNYASLPSFLSNSGDPWAGIDASACSLGAELAAKLAS